MKPKAGFWLILMLLLCTWIISGCSRGDNGSSDEPGTYSRELSGDFGGYITADIDDWPVKSGERTRITASADIFRKDAQNSGQDIIHDYSQIFYRTTGGGPSSEWRRMTRPGVGWDHVEAYETFQPGRHILDFKFGTISGNEFLLTGWAIEVK